MTRSEWVSTLPPWRRLLAMLNWRPVYDIEQQAMLLELNALESERDSEQWLLESEQRLQESEKRLLESEQRLQESERRLKLLENEDKRLAELESRLDALLLNADSSSQTPPATGSN